MKFGKRVGGKEALRQPRISSDVTSRNNNVVFSYHARPGRSGEQKQAVAKQNRLDGLRKSSQTIKQLRWRHLPSVVAMLAVLLSVGYLSTISPNPRLVLLGQSDGANLLRAKQDYVAASQDILKRNIADKSKITIDSAGFSREMKQRFPELSDVAITLPLMGRRPVVEVVASQPVLRISSQGQTYLLDAGGKALIKQTDASNIAQTRLFEVKDQSNLPLDVGKGALPKESVTFITTFINQLVQTGLAPSEISLPAKASELQVRLKDASYYLKASVMTDPRVAAGQFLAVKKRLEAEGKKPSEYIDVRIEEKVYVK